MGNGLKGGNETKIFFLLQISKMSSKKSLESFLVGFFFFESLKRTMELTD